MNVTKRSFPVDYFEITDVENLDPVTVFLQDFGTGQGRITVECWGNAWSCYFGGMGTNTIRQFVASAGTDYLVNKLTGQLHKQTKRNEAYLRKIVDAVKAALQVTQ